ncbi:DUF3574 domain-containing protein [Streptomyces sp. WMMC500]|uniref:DUF3574 domain-containing protein n=1 Tax=Streptomyces sp. WMMC500 TaxID=3015154 RepID=UPI00248B7604|nr:DUF3574 domain-containing protein [Streptomyces sp. WMMC500]WBB59720.1 DUF3574 domain-containing protein [Streptomyces sp. WMMC500]
MNLTKPRLRLVALTLAAALAGAAAATAPAALADGETTAPAAPPQAADLDPYVQTHLMFGTVRPDGGPDVTDRQFRAFVDRVVTPRFPAGLTVDEVRGQYRDRHGTIERERSYEVYLLYPLTEAGEQDGRIEEIREAYTRRFAQESVARVDEPARAGF